MDLVFLAESFLPHSLCDEIITRYEMDNRVKEGAIKNKGIVGVYKYKKDTKDISIQNYEDWNDITFQLNEYLNKSIQMYIEWLGTKFPEYPNLLKQPYHNQGFMIQKYELNGFFDWHSDVDIFNENNTIRSRVFTYIFYLNDLEDSGETDFYFKKIKPKKGSLVMFPATWCYPHKGNVCKSEKYICTGWVYT